MKIIAFYLPQFHCIPENDEWWGKGFTEWTNTKKAKKLFTEHYQPREPLNDNYYNLLNPETQKWQAKLAKEYGVYGFCYYHYWFNEKQLLEKPINQVLELGEPDFPFCLSWANEPWTRIWYAGKENEVLVPQYYGTDSDWKKHFDYLLPFFLDKRYIRIDDKPLFVIYRPESIGCCDEMLKYWNELAQEQGIHGIYYVKMLTCYSKNFKAENRFCAQVEFEPGYTIKVDPPLMFNISRLSKRLLKKVADRCGIRSKYLLDKINYDVLWRHIINRKHNKKTFLGAFIDWDNTARKGHDPMIIDGFSVKKFEDYLYQQICRSKSIYKNDYLFINAWNEWAEGTYLEPDKKFGFAYLEAVKNALQRSEQL